MKRSWNVRNPSLAKSAAPWGMQFKETTLTDYVVLRLLEECKKSIEVFTFPSRLEARTGADMEMWFTDSTRRWFGLRIQCKVLSSHETFEELHYRRNKNGQYQSDILIQSTNVAGMQGCLPIYLLYVGPSPYCPQFCPCMPGSRLYPKRYLRLGNWWISAYRVKQLRPNKHLRDLLPYMHPWQCFVCCPDPGTNNVEAMLYVLRETVFSHDEEVRRIEAVSVPPKYVQLALEGRLPDAIYELQGLLEGHEMRHLAIVKLEE